MNNPPKGSDMADHEFIAILNTYHDQSNYDPSNLISYLNKALTDLQAYISEVIGEDEKADPANPAWHPDYVIRIQNILRAEQRRRAGI